MDFDPRPIFAAVRAPVLAFHGERDNEERLVGWLS